MAILVNSASGNTIKTIRQDIRFIFNHSRDVISFEVKALDHGQAMLYVHMFIDTPVILKMTWASYTVMLQTMVYSRAWRRRFAGFKIRKYGTETIYQINN